MNRRIALLGMQIDVLRMTEAVAQLIEWLDDSDRRCRYVVTPNVDHAVMFQEHPGLRAAYADAGLVLADGMPVIWASRLLRRPLPERVPGSDLVPELFAGLQRRGVPRRVFLLGAAPGVADRAAATIEQTWSRIQVVGTYSPPLGFEHQPDQNREILDRIAAARPDVLIIGLGAPKQELWVHRQRGELPVPLALCVGATIDFLAEEKARAPVWMRRVGLEWLHRVMSEPRRLSRRYLRDAWLFPRLVWRDWRSAAV